MWHISVIFTCTQHMIDCRDVQFTCACLQQPLHAGLRGDTERGSKAETRTRVACVISMKKAHVSVATCVTSITKAE